MPGVMVWQLEVSKSSPLLANRKGDLMEAQESSWPDRKGSQRISSHGESPDWKSEHIRRYLKCLGK